MDVERLESKQLSLSIPIRKREGNSQNASLGAPGVSRGETKEREEREVQSS